MIRAATYQPLTQPQQDSVGTDRDIGLARLGIGPWSSTFLIEYQQILIHLVVLNYTISHLDHPIIVHSVCAFASLNRIWNV